MTERDKVQVAAFEQIVKNGYHGIVDVAPRVGKTKIGIDTISKYLEDNPDAKIVVTSPFATIRENWIVEFNKWNFNPYQAIISICNSSLDKIKECDLLIIDEVHTLSDNQILDIKKFKPKSIIGLTGTLSEKTENNLRFNFGTSVLYRFTIEEAIERKIISNYRILVHLLDLDKVYSNFPVKFYGGNIKLMTEQEAYDYFSKQFERYKASAEVNPQHAKTKMFFAGQRARALYQFETKIEAVKSCIRQINDRHLTFTILTKIANRLEPYSYHSKSPKNTLERFINQNIDELAVCNMVNMGITIPNLKFGIMHQIQSNEEKAVQKVLRMCNLEDTKEAVIHVFAYRNTVDEDWLRKGLKGLHPDKIEYV